MKEGIRLGAAFALGVIATLAWTHFGDTSDCPVDVVEPPPRATENPAAKAIPKVEPQPVAVEPAAAASDAPFRRVGTRADFDVAADLIDDIGDLSEGWARSAARQLDLDEPAIAAMAAAFASAADAVGDFGRDYIAGDMDRATLRARYWATRKALDARLVEALSADQMKAFDSLRAGAIQSYAWLPALVGESAP